MQRRPSHPHGQFTGMIIIVALMASIGMVFWVPSTPSQLPALAAEITTSTPALPITRTPRPERDPQASAPVVVEPTAEPIDWSTIPTAIPADQIILPTVAPPVYVPHPAPAPAVVIYQPAPPPDTTALIAAQQELAAAQAQAQQQANAMQAQADAALESQRQQDARHATEMAAANDAPAVVNPADFIQPDPQAKCQFIGCL